MKNHSIYKTLKNCWTTNPTNKEKSRENWFVSYAVRGPTVVPSMGLESGMPLLYPIPGPVREPSVLNTRWKYSRPWPKNSIL